MVNPLRVEVRGAEQFDRLGRRLKAEGERGKGLRRELLKEIRTEARPLQAKVKAAALAIPASPPEDRGLRRDVAAKVRIAIRLTGKRAGLRITVGKLDGTNLPRRLNKGQWRHPVFKTGTWVVQTVQPGWFDKTVSKGAQPVRAGVLRAMRRVADRIAH